MVKDKRKVELGETDLVLKVGKSSLHHGAASDRVYLMQVDEKDLARIWRVTQHLVEQYGYTKIFAKVDDYGAAFLKAKGFELEAEVPGFFSGRKKGYFLGKYMTPQRREKDNAFQVQEILKVSQGQKKKEIKVVAANEFKHREGIEILQKENIVELVALYRDVFESYPFPIFEKDYLAKTMDEQVTYYGLRKNGKLVAVASAEMNHKKENVEMTDFATLKSFRGQGVAQKILAVLEDDMRKRRFLTAYTICRALSAGMNITFARQGYKFAGTLWNNTNISGGIESMNVWYKPL